MQCRVVACWWLACASLAMAGPYPPDAEEPGSTALQMNTNLFIGWASSWTNYEVGAECAAQWQTPGEALGKAGTDVEHIVCLGRGGRITMTFDMPIGDGPGFDFAVFENSFEPFASFLELAYVEVSSDGTHFHRFANDSLTPGPIGAFEVLDTTDVTGLAGKYRIGFGTPFDLAELSSMPLLDVQNVRQVRLVDVVGDGSHLDSSGDPIYDPYPTVGSAGFDLDAVGVIHSPITCSLAMAPTGSVVTWRAHTNRLYQLQRRDDADPGWSNVAEAVAGNGSWHSLADTNPPATLRFYRVIEAVAP